MESIEISVPTHDNNIKESDIYINLYAKYLSSSLSGKISEEEFIEHIKNSKLSDDDIKSTVVGLIKTGNLFDVINVYKQNLEINEKQQLESFVVANDSFSKINYLDSDYLVFPTINHLLNYLENNDLDFEKMNFAIKMEKLTSSAEIDSSFLNNCVSTAYQKTGENYKFNTQSLGKNGYYLVMSKTYVKRKKTN